MDVAAIFQVWSKVGPHKINLERAATCKNFIAVFSLSDGGTPASARNKNMLHKCDVYLPSTCFTGMRAYKNFEALPHRRGYGVLIHKEKPAIQKLLLHNDWQKTAFASTNGALKLRTSMIYGVVMRGGYCDV